MFADNRFVKNRLSCFQKSSRERERVSKESIFAKKTLVENFLSNF